MEESDREQQLQDGLREVVEAQLDQKEFLLGIVLGGASEELAEAYDRLEVALLRCRWHREALEEELAPDPGSQRLAALAAETTGALEHAVRVLLRVAQEQMRASRAEADERHQELLAEIRQLRAYLQS